MGGWFAKVNNSVYVGAAILAASWIWLVTIQLFQQAGAVGGLWIFALLFGPFICTLAHELGHAVFAILGGWRVTLIHVAPFAWRPSDSRFAFVGARGGQDLAGYCAMTPGKANAARAGYILGVLGGPVASIALAVLASSLATAFAGHLAAPEGVLVPGPDADGFVTIRIERQPESWLQAVTPFFGSIALQSGYAALFSLWPADLKSGANDGALIAQALTHDRDLRNPFTWANGLMREGVSPRDWPKWMVAAIGKMMNGESRPSGAAMLALYIAIDASPMDVRGARNAIECIRTSEAWDDPHVRDWLLKWDAIVTSLLEGDAERAAMALDSIDPSLQGDVAATMAAKASIAARRGDVLAMKQSLTKLEAELRREPLRASAWIRLASAIRDSAARPSQSPSL